MRQAKATTRLLEQEYEILLRPLTRRISSCMRCFFVSRVDASGFNFRVHRSLYRSSKLGFRCSVTGSTGGNMSGRRGILTLGVTRVLCLVLTVKTDGSTRPGMARSGALVLRPPTHRFGVFIVYETMLHRVIIVSLRAVCYPSTV